MRQQVSYLPPRENSAMGDPDLEMSIIGAVLHRPESMVDAMILSRHAFQDKVCAGVWNIILTQHKKGGSLSIATIANEYPELGPLGGARMLAGMMSRGEEILTDIPEKVEALRRLHKWRQIMALSTRLAQACSEQDKSPDEILSGTAAFCIDSIKDGRDTAQRKRDVAQAAVNRASEHRETAGTGINSLDYLMQGGLQPGRLYGIGGLFGRGKTICLGSISDNLDRQDHKHIFISLETDPMDIEIRNCGRALNLNASSLSDSDDAHHEEFIIGAQGYVAGIKDNVLYEFMPGGAINEIHRAIIRAKHRYGIKGFILDYWQLIRGREKHQTEESHLREAANLLGALCRTENIWGIVAAQTDQNGQLRISEGLKVAASLYIRLQREENDEAAYFITEKSNYTRYMNTGRENVPGMIFDMAGPHFRNTESIDINRIASNPADDITI